MSPPPRLLLAPFLPPGGCFHVARSTYRADSLHNLHTHDFAEVFWVEDGAGWHWINGQRLRLEARDMVLIRPMDVHGFTAGRHSTLTFTNVAFALRHLGLLRRRYFTSGSSWPWRGAELPTRIRLGPQDLDDLTRWAQRASMVRQAVIDLHGFLIDVLRLAIRPVVTSIEEHTWASVPPLWLAEAIRGMAGVEQLRRGVPALAELAHRSPAHVNRIVRGCLGRTSSELVNRLRMEHVGRQLRMTDRKIMDIAGDVGLTHVSYFYRLFHAHFGASPRRYRVREQTLLHGAG